MKVKVNWDACDGNGNCASAAPELFALDNDDVLQVLKQALSEQDRPYAKAAVRACPKAAIAIED